MIFRMKFSSFKDFKNNIHTCENKSNLNYYAKKIMKITKQKLQSIGKIKTKNSKFQKLAQL